MKHYWVIVLGVCVAGCTSVGKIEKKYQAVDKTDGINRVEAEAMAKKILVESSYRKNYAYDTGKVMDNAVVHQYPDYWFVTFREKDFDRSFWNYLVVIQKEAGDVVFADVYEPFRYFDFDWVFKNKK